MSQRRESSDREISPQRALRDRVGRYGASGFYKQTQVKRRITEKTSEGSPEKRANSEAAGTKVTTEHEVSVEIGIDPTASERNWGANTGLQPLNPGASPFKPSRTRKPSPKPEMKYIKNKAIGVTSGKLQSLDSDPEDTGGDALASRELASPESHEGESSDSRRIERSESRQTGTPDSGRPTGYVPAHKKTPFDTNPGRITTALPPGYGPPPDFEEPLGFQFTSATGSLYYGDDDFEQPSYASYGGPKQGIPNQRKRTRSMNRYRDEVTKRDREQHPRRPPFPPEMFEVFQRQYDINPDYNKALDFVEQQVLETNRLLAVRDYQAPPPSSASTSVEISLPAQAVEDDRQVVERRTITTRPLRQAAPSNVIPADPWQPDNRLTPVSQPRAEDLPPDEVTANEEMDTVEVKPRDDRMETAEYGPTAPTGSVDMETTETGVAIDEQFADVDEDQSEATFEYYSESDVDLLGSEFPEEDDDDPDYYQESRASETSEEYLTPDEDDVFPPGASMEDIYQSFHGEGGLSSRSRRKKRQDERGEIQGMGDIQPLLNLSLNPEGVANMPIDEVGAYQSEIMDSLDQFDRMMNHLNPMRARALSEIQRASLRLDFNLHRRVLFVERHHRLTLAEAKKQAARADSLDRELKKAKLAKDSYQVVLENKQEETKKFKEENDRLRERLRRREEEMQKVRNELAESQRELRAAEDRDEAFDARVSSAAATGLKLAEKQDTVGGVKEIKKRGTGPVVLKAQAPATVTSATCGSSAGVVSPMREASESDTGIRTPSPSGTGMSQPVTPMSTRGSDLLSNLKRTPGLMDQMAEWLAERMSPGPPPTPSQEERDHPVPFHMPNPVIRSPQGPPVRVAQKTIVPRQEKEGEDDAETEKSQEGKDDDDDVHMKKKE